MSKTGRLLALLILIPAMNGAAGPAAPTVQHQTDSPGARSDCPDAARRGGG